MRPRPSMSIVDNLDILHHLDHSDRSNHFDNRDWSMINQEDNCRIRIVYLVLFIIYNFVNSCVSRVPSKVLIYTGSLMPTADMRFPLIFSAQFSPRTEEDLSNLNLPQNLKGERFKVCKPGISDKRCHFWILRFSLWEWNLLQNYSTRKIRYLPTHSKLKYKLIKLSHINMLLWS